MPQSFASFLIICFLLTITPGADTALILKSAISGGRKLYVPTILGICSGLLVHATMSSLGLSVILQQSAQLYSIVKLAGAGYLFFLGGRTLFEAWKTGLQKTDPTFLTNTKPLRRESGSEFAEFRSGLLTNVLNPKVAVFYLTFLPQFVDVKKNVFVQSILLSAVHAAMNFVWLFLIGSFVGYFRSQLSKPQVRQALDSMTGLALVGFALQLALSQK